MNHKGKGTLRGKNLYISLFIKSNGICYLCDRAMDENFNLFLDWHNWKMRLKGTNQKLPVRRKHVGLNVDHIIPKSLDKSKDSPLRQWDNLALTHSKCNNKKGNKVVTYNFAQYHELF